MSPENGILLALSMQGPGLAAGGSPAGGQWETLSLVSDVQQDP